MMEKIPDNKQVPAVGEKEKKNFMIRQVCMYCKEQYGEKEGGEFEGQISHGMCSKPGCIEKFMEGTVEEE